MEPVESIAEPDISGVHYFTNHAIVRRDKETIKLHIVWVNEPFKNEPKLQVFRFATVIFGVSSSVFLLNATIHYIYIIYIILRAMQTHTSS